MKPADLETIRAIAEKHGILFWEVPELAEPKYHVGDVVRFQMGDCPQDVATLVAEAQRSNSPMETDWYYLASNQHAEGFVLGEDEIVGKVAGLPLSINVRADTRPVSRTLHILKIVMHMPLSTQVKVRLCKMVIRLMPPYIRYRMDGSKWYRMPVEIDVFEKWNQLS